MIEFIKTKYIFKKNFMIIKNGKKSYKWHIYGQDVKTLTEAGNFIPSIIHNINNCAMIDFEDRITNESVYRCEINPLSYTGDEWVEDIQ